MRSKLVLIATFPVLVIAAVAGPATAQRRGPPTGAEIATKARAARFSAANTGVGTFHGKTMKLTPAVLDGVTPEELKAGQVLGVMENGAAGDETGLPPGRYNLFVAYVDGQWRGYAESGGRIISPAIRTSIANVTPTKTPQFKEKGWCFLAFWSWTGGTTSFLNAYFGGTGHWICF